ncbi:MAG: tRNA pseudouridine(55) synthase TruB [Oscillospiraceae bacterium]|nr:tRNA pseudouridine(55) synthase TruB [Oscillospiraceae bacterium]
MPNGIIIIDKPAGWTSQDVAAKLRGVFHERRIGHGGTLDPMATGVLPIFVGRATRAVEFFEHAEKEYVAGLRLGLVTNTQDTTGETQEEHPVSVTRQQLLAVLEQFRGEQEQLPPMYSAVKIGGKKLYEMARQGKTVERKPRKIHIFELELLSGEMEEYLIRVKCSKGTYIRTLCHDIGQALGCGGCMSSLRRTMAGCYDLSKAVTMEQVLQGKTELLPVDSLFSHLPAVTVTQLKPIYNGAAVKMPQLSDGQYRVYAPDGEFLMVGQAEKGLLKTVKSFFEVKDL